MLNPKSPFIRLLFVLACALCLTPFVSSAGALMGGLVFSLALGNPFPEFVKSATHRLLQVSVVGLGAGMNLHVIGHVGAQGVGYTAIGILLTVFAGLALGRFLKIKPNTSLLLTVGTAICGGSAIAATASTIKAKSDEISVSLATVFSLNALALLIFPPIGHRFGLSQNQFGLWSALAIHDTSSVVGAAIQYGKEALEIAIPVKLARALWIIPLCLGIGVFWKHGTANNNRTKASSIKKPWFILWFLLAATLVTEIPSLAPAGQLVSTAARHTLVLTLFLIGSTLTRETLRDVGMSPFLHGFLLWTLTTVGTLSAILGGWIK